MSTEQRKVQARAESRIIHANEPLTIEEIQYAMALMDLESGENSIEEEALIDEGTLVSICAGPVAVDPESKIMRLVHYTTQEYFERNRQDDNMLCDAQSQITTACIR